MTATATATTDTDAGALTAGAAELIAEALRDYARTAWERADDAGPLAERYAALGARTLASLPLTHADAQLSAAALWRAADELDLADPEQHRAAERCCEHAERLSALVARLRPVHS